MLARLWGMLARQSSEVVRAAARRMELLKPSAKERQREGNSAGGQKAGRGRPKPDNPSDSSPSNGREPIPSPSDTESRTQAARSVRYSVGSLSRAESVLDAAEDDPDTFSSAAMRSDTSADPSP